MDLLRPILALSGAGMAQSHLNGLDEHVTAKIGVSSQLHLAPPQQNYLRYLGMAWLAILRMVGRVLVDKSSCSVVHGFEG
jgi:hypothetical protein